MKQIIHANWKTLGLRGILLVGFGIFALASPALATLALVRVLGIMFFVVACVSVVIFLMLRQNSSYNWMWLVWGITDAVIGICIFLYPQRTTEIFVMLVGIFAIGMSVASLIMTFTFKSYKLILVMNAIISLLFGLLILYNPFSGAVALTLLIGVYSLLMGITICYFSWKLKNMNVIIVN